MSELAAIETAIVTLLRADPALATVGVWLDAVPQTAPFPAIVFSQHGQAFDTQGNGAARVATVAAYIVKVVGEADGFKATCADIERRMDAALRSGKWQSGGIYVTCHRQSAASYTQTVGDGKAARQYRHLGGVYRFFVSGG